MNELVKINSNGQWYIEDLEKTGGNIRQRGTGISHGSSETRFIGQSVVGRPYSNPGGSSKEQIKHQEQQLKTKNRLQPVKVFSEKEKEELAHKMGLKKSEELSIHPNGQWSLT
jgi:hypothetical protein